MAIIKSGVGITDSAERIDGVVFDGVGKRSRTIRGWPTPRMKTSLHFLRIDAAADKLERRFDLFAQPVKDEWTAAKSKNPDSYMCESYYHQVCTGEEE